MRADTDAASEDNDESGPAFQKEYVIDADVWTGEMFGLEANRTTALETQSVWGAAIVIPQVARSVGFNLTAMVLTFRTYFNLCCCVAVQMLLLTYIGQSTQVYAPLGGQMHLCDFGANLDACPDAPHCVGPGGTKYASTRLYGYTQWVVQKFVRDAFLHMHPDRRDEIEQKIDPGEYGLESYRCRVLCIVLFVSSVVPEILACVSMAHGLYNLQRCESNEARGSWVVNSATTTDDLKRSNTMSGLASPQSDLFIYRMGGMPLRWKIFNFCFLLCPKVMILHFVLREGSVLLMETAGIMEMILGAMSLTYLLSMDDMFFEYFSTQPAQVIMKRLRPVVDHADEARIRRNIPAWNILLSFFPLRFCTVVLFAMGYILLYYSTKCVWRDGRFVSKDMHLPERSTYHISDFMFDSILHTLHRSDKAFWTWPPDKSR
jgi:hypothetical protein